MRTFRVFVIVGVHLSDRGSAPSSLFPLGSVVVVVGIDTHRVVVRVVLERASERFRLGRRELLHLVLDLDLLHRQEVGYRRQLFLVEGREDGVARRRVLESNVEVESSRRR